MIGRRDVWCLSVWLLLWLATPARPAAQVGSGALGGTVRDETGAPLPGATVTATASGTRQTRMALTGQDGAYTFPSLPPGTYRIRAELNGFRPLAHDGVKIATGETIRLELSCKWAD
jgi:protocatechuate 3,4-dioxygenase beta subunit